MKKAVLILVVLTAMISATAAWSQGRPGFGGPGGAGTCPAMLVMPPRVEMIDRMSDTLQLTDDQATELKEILTDGGTTIQPLTKAAAEASKALHDSLLASTYDAQSVKDLAVKAEKAEAAVITASIDVWTKIRAVLTTDQVTKLKEAMSAPPTPGPRPGAGFGPGGPGGPGGPPPPMPGQ